MPNKRKKDNNIVETPIEALDLSVRMYQSLKRSGIHTVGDVISLLEDSDTVSVIQAIRRFDESSLAELREKMLAKGYLRNYAPSYNRPRVYTVDDYIENIDNTVAQLSEAIDDFDNRFREIEEVVGDANIKNEIGALKDTTSKLSTQFLRYLENNVELIASAAEVRSIPRIEQRLANLEEALERKRNWGLNIWLLVLTIIFGFATCISTVAAVWALFLR